MSPENCRPPSPITGTPAGLAASDAWWIAVTCGTPTPATTRVVQIEPGPTPTLTASHPASTSACAPSRVAMLPPITWTPDIAGSALSRRTMSSISRAWPFAVSTTSTSTPASTRAVARSQASPKNPTAAPTTSRPSPSLVASGYCSDLTKSLTVISPCSRPSVSTSGSFSTLCLASTAEASSREIPTGAVTSGIEVIASRTRVVPNVLGGTNRRSRLVMIPSSTLSWSTTGRPDTRNFAQSASSSLSVASGPIVSGSLTMPDSDRLTRSTCAAWSAIGRLRCRIPTPPWRAIAIAIRPSVTVSIAADTSGIRRVSSRVRRVLVSASLGMTSVSPGSRSTSS